MEELLTGLIKASSLPNGFGSRSVAGLTAFRTDIKAAARWAWNKMMLLLFKAGNLWTGVTRMRCHCGDSVTASQEPGYGHVCV